MSPLQIAAISVLLLACVYLSLGAHIPARREASTMTVAMKTEAIKSVANRTGTEAGHAKLQTDDYFKAVYKNNDLDVTATCSARLVNSTVHKCLQSVPESTSKECMVKVSTNLQCLLPTYSCALGLINLSDKNQMEQLDLLEMVYYRLFSQIQRYLQAHNLPSGHDFVKCTSSEDPRLECTQNVEVVLCRLREMAKRAMDIIKEDIGKDNITLRPYKFCHSANHVNCDTQP